MEAKKEKKLDRTKEIERSIIKRFRKEIWHPFVQALNDFELIKEGDKIAVCISGGKDSMLLSKCLQEIQRHGKIKFDLEFIVMDPGYHKDNIALIEKNIKTLGIPAAIYKSDIFDSVTHIDSSPCYICARMRRGWLYAKARELGCNKIALGHHANDVVETTLMSVLYAGQFNTMMPKLHSENFAGMELIRPLYYVREDDVIRWKNYNKLRFLHCACRFTEIVEEEKLLGEEAMTSKRSETKALIAKLLKTNPYVEKNIYKSAVNVNLDKCIGYTKKGVKHNFLEEYNRDNYTYIVECADGSYYCGWTNNIERRLKAHNGGKAGAKYTHAKGPVKLVYFEAFATRSEAMKREAEIKKLSRPQKEELIKSERNEYRAE